MYAHKYVKMLCVVVVLTLVDPSSVRVFAEDEAGEPRKQEPNALMDIPHLSILSLRTPKECLRMFKEKFGVSPVGVILPVVTPDGVSFENELRLQRRLLIGAADQAHPWTLQSAAKKFAELGKDIYLLVVPSMSFASNVRLNLVDITGDEIEQACLYRSGTITILHMLTKQAFTEVRKEIEGSGTPARLRGIVLDITNLWPMSAQEQRIEFTGFCEECTTKITELGVDVDDFRRHPNAWNLLLKDSGFGIAHVDDLVVTADIGTLIKQIVTYSRQKRFYPIELRDDERDRLARKAATYLIARQKITLEAIRKFFDELDGESQDFLHAVLTDASKYNWTSGVSLAALDNKDICDEVWIDPPSWTLHFEKVALRAYMWERTRYFIDAFFDFSFTALDEGWRNARDPSEGAERDLQIRLHILSDQVKAGELGSALDMILLPDSFKKRLVGVALDKEMTTNLHQAISDQIERNKRAIKGAQPDRGTDRTP